MATGKRAFRRASESETHPAIVRDQPEPVARLNPKIPPPVRWIIERCLSKDPRDRYASTLDLARELQNLRDRSAELAAVETASVPTAVHDAGFRRFRGLAWSAMSIGLLAVLVGAFFLAHNTKEVTSSFRQLTFAQSNITGARFAADGQNVIYGTNSAGNAPELSTTRPGNPESRSLRLPGSGIWSISPSGEMAVAVGCTLNWGDCMGTLALALFLRAAGDMKLNIFKLDLGSHRREFWKEFAPPHASGLIGIATDPGQVRLTADGRSYAYTYWTFPSDLYVVEGLR